MHVTKADLSEVQAVPFLSRSLKVHGANKDIPDDVSEHLVNASPGPDDPQQYARERRALA